MGIYYVLRFIPLMQKAFLIMQLGLYILSIYFNFPIGYDLL